jgi:hypothetical protein
MGEQRHWTTFGAARKFETAAREAENKRNFRLAAALYRAALLMLKGESFDDAQVLTHAGCDAAAYGERSRWGGPSHRDSTPPPTDEKP